MNKSTRPRACAAIIRDEKILMVRHQNNERSYWTLPGGGVIEGENLEQAVVREVLEETCLDVNVVKFLFEEQYEYGVSYCFLASAESAADAKLGIEPEEKDVDYHLSMLQEVGWHSLESMKDDQQVSRVIALLALPIVGDTSGSKESNQNQVAKD
jgi:8-oxo-dGTP diphosphatase